MENGLVAFYHATRKPSCMGILHNKMETYAHMKLYTGMKPAVFPIAKEVSNPSIHEQSMGAQTHSQMGFYLEWKRRNPIQHGRIPNACAKWKTPDFKSEYWWLYLHNSLEIAKIIGKQVSYCQSCVLIKKRPKLSRGWWYYVYYHAYGGGYTTVHVCQHSWNCTQTIVNLNILLPSLIIPR